MTVGRCSPCPCCSHVAAQSLLHNCTCYRLQAEGCGPPEVATCGRDGAVRVWDVRQQDAPVAAFEPAPGEEVGCAPACLRLYWRPPPGQLLLKGWAHVCSSPRASIWRRGGVCSRMYKSVMVAAIQPFSFCEVRFLLLLFELTSCGSQHLAKRWGPPLNVSARKC